MNCDNIFCIYYEQNQCTLDSISLDITGACLDCIYVQFSEEELQKARNRLLEQFDNY